MTPNTPLRVQGATAYPVTAASARVRVANYVPFLAEHDVALRHTPTVSCAEYAVLRSDTNPAIKAALVARGALHAIRLRDHDSLLLLHRLLLLTPVPGLDPPRRLDIYDFDDDLLTGSTAVANRHFQWIKQESRRAIACMRRARVVIAANARLAGQAASHATRVEVVPSCVDPSIQTVRRHEDTEVITIGWIGSHTTVGYLLPLMPVIERLNRAGRLAKLVVVGGDTGVRADWIEHRSWSTETQAADLATFDIGVMPLPDTEWTRGKSGYKLLQYFAAAVPAIASPVGINTSLVSDGRGLTATTDVEWERALRELMVSASERRQRGERARSFVAREYSYQRWAPELAEMLKSLSH